MNETIKTKWLKALRGGDYQQGRRQLRGGDRYCCLGVLCDLHSKSTGIEWKPVKHGNFAYLDSDVYLPQQVIDWAKLDHWNPLVDGHLRLGSENDRGATFQDIANLIEKYL